MLPFDKAMSSYMQKIGGLYRRFCDDILMIIPRDLAIKDEAISFVKSEIAKRGPKLKLHPINEWDRYSKSQCFDFKDTHNILKKPFSYLGITYDGKNVRLRQSSVSKYQRRVIKAVNAVRIKRTCCLKAWIEDKEKKKTLKIKDLRLKKEYDKQIIPIPITL